ncbi:MAG: SWF/SNF helicase family protein, partial [Lachnospiraceae bacterium]|nr:SWF/SNF helicase family protein [Lachnospiraceae bacterium]
VKTRSRMVEEFNGEDYIPYMVLSVKAGGTGLNLTSANHVIHFDRWWNPAVENQATDRAFRIGQKKNVFVHKLVCEKTIEEKIDQMLKFKKELAENVIGGSGENWITDLSNEELLSILKLDM